MRQFLDRLYLGAGWIAAIIILGIAVLVSAQVSLNLSTRIFSLPLPSTIPSYADFSGFMLASATFLAMPYTFRSGGHIKVSLITSRFSTRGQFYAEIFALTASAALVGYACYFIFVLIYESWHFEDMSTGIIPVPLWIPQSSMAVGMSLLFISIVDSFIQTIAKHAPVIKNSEEA